MSEVGWSNVESQGPSQSQESQELETVQKEDPSDNKCEVVSEKTCLDLESKCLSQSQENQELEALQTDAPKDYKHEALWAPASLWKISTVILGIICLASSFGYITMFYQCLSKAEVYQGNVSDIKEASETVIQNSSNAEGHPGDISSNKEANKIVWKYPTCSPNWHQHGEKCYYFSRNKSVWKKCDNFCTDTESRFLKVDNEDEMTFIMKLSKMQCDMQQEKFFISFHYNSIQLKWIWEDGSDLTLAQFPIQGYENAEKKCIHIKYGQIIFEDCQTDGYCICKKTVLI